MKIDDTSTQASAAVLLIQGGMINIGVRRAATMQMGSYGTGAV